MVKNKITTTVAAADNTLVQEGLEIRGVVAVQEKMKAD